MDLLKLYAVTLSSILGVWTIYRDFINKGKLKLVIFTESHNNDPKEKFLYVDVYNIGKKPIYFNKIGIHWDNEVFYLHSREYMSKIEPGWKHSFGSYSCDFELNELIEENDIIGNIEKKYQMYEEIRKDISSNLTTSIFVQKLKSIWVEDAIGKKFKFEDKNFKKIKIELIEYNRMIYQDKIKRTKQ